MSAGGVSAGAAYISNNWTRAVDSASNLGMQIQLKISGQQLGKKWGKHQYDYPHLKGYSDYKRIAMDIFSNPDKIIMDSVNEEYYYLKGMDLLRMRLDGTFVSLYPGAESEKVINAILYGGMLWEK